MPVDNTIYDRLAHTWWDEEGVLHLTATMLNPARFTFFREVLVERLEVGLAEVSLLDIGCGGGLLAEEFAGLGSRVVGVDLSLPSIRAARKHASGVGFGIQYAVAAGERLPFEDESFDAAACGEVLEHVRDPDAVIAEGARVLRRGGVFLYDTVNRTLASRTVTIWIAQECPWTRFLPKDLHDWHRYIRPRELDAMLASHGIRPVNRKGIRPSARPLRLLRSIRRYRRGEIGLGELGRRLRFEDTRDTAVAYVGYGIRTAGP